MKKRIAAWPTVPANDATIVLFATHDRKAGGSGALFQGMSGVRGLAPSKIDAIEVVFHTHNKASHANGIRLFARDDQGAWQATDLKGSTGTATLGAIQVPALSGIQEYRILLDVARYPRGWALEYVAGADNPENWTGTITLHAEIASLVR